MQGDVEAAIGVDAGVDDLLDVGLGVDVGGYADDVGAGLLADALGGGINAGLIAARDDEFDSFAGESEGTGITEAAAGGVNDGAFAFESEIHV